MISTEDSREKTVQNVLFVEKLVTSDETVEGFQRIVINKTIDTRLMVCSSNNKESIWEILWQETNEKRPSKMLQ